MEDFADEKLRALLGRLGPGERILISCDGRPGGRPVIWAQVLRPRRNKGGEKVVVSTFGLSLLEALAQMAKVLGVHQTPLPEEPLFEHKVSKATFHLTIPDTNAPTPPEVIL